MATYQRSVNAFRRVRANPAAVGVGVVTLFALAVRLFGLGSRVAHYDEARVGYWILRYQANGIWEYHAIIHGPFLYHVNRLLFELVGASDFVARLPVAVVGGLLPAAAWLLRDRLRDSEMIALGLFLAANPLLLYYSRFMRNDVLLAGFAFFAFAFFVRAYDARDPRHLYAGTAAFALAFTAKENVLLYPLIWAGATVLLLDHRLFLVRDDGDWVSALAARLSSTARGVRRWKWRFLAATAEFFAIVVYFYAPRAGPTDGPGLWKAVGDPGTFPAVVAEATVGSWNEFVGQWGGSGDHPYIPYFMDLGDVLAQGAAPLVALAVAGFLADRYAGDRPRDVVAFAFYWGFVSVFGYPLIVDNSFPWEEIHVVVPLAIPAAVGAALVYRWSREAVADDDMVSAGLAALVLVLVAGQVGTTAMQTSYAHPADRYLDADAGTENRLIQYGQPAEGLRPTLETVDAVVGENEGTDVLYYGFVEGRSSPDPHYVFYVPDESDNDRWPAAEGWYNRLPLPWYTELYGANVDSTDDPSELRNPPPVVVARATNRSEVEPRLDGYRLFGHELTLWGSETDIYVRTSAIRNATEGDA